MPCFIYMIQELGVKVPKNVFLFADHKIIEEHLKEKLSVDTHKEVHEKMKEMDIDILKDIVEKVLNDVAKEKESAPPDRLKKQREQREKWVTAN